MRFRLGIQAPLIVATAVALAVSCIFAALWDTWPGDVAGIRFLQSLLNGVTRPVTQGVNFLVDDLTLVGLVVVAAVWLIYRRLPRLALLLAIAVLLVTFAVKDLKWLVPRPSPGMGGDFPVLGETSKFAYPSGHVPVVGLYFGTLMYLVNRHWSGRRWRRLGLMLALFVPVASIGPSRIAWGIHWPSDVIGGYLLAALALLMIRAAHHRFIDSRQLSESLT